MRASNEQATNLYVLDQKSNGEELMIGTKAPDIHVMMRLTGRCWQVLYFCSISKYRCAMGNYICK